MGIKTKEPVEGLTGEVCTGVDTWVSMCRAKNGKVKFKGKTHDNMKDKFVCPNSITDEAGKTLCVGGKVAGKTPEEAAAACKASGGSVSAEDKCICEEPSEPEECDCKCQCSKAE